MLYFFKSLFLAAREGASPQEQILRHSETNVVDKPPAVVLQFSCSPPAVPLQSPLQSPCSVPAVPAHPPAIPAVPCSPPCSPLQPPCNPPYTFSYSSPAVPLQSPWSPPAVPLQSPCSPPAVPCSPPAVLLIPVLSGSILLHFLLTLYHVVEQFVCCCCL